MRYVSLSFQTWIKHSVVYMEEKSIYFIEADIAWLYIYITRCTISHFLVGRYSFVIGPPSPGRECLKRYFNMRETPVNDEDGDGNKENDENGNTNRPGGNSCSAPWTTAVWCVLH